VGVVVGTCLENPVDNFAASNVDVSIILVPISHGIECPLNFDLEEVLCFLFGLEGNALNLVSERHVGEVAGEVCNASVILQFHDRTDVFVDGEFAEEIGEDFRTGEGG